MSLNFCYLKIINIFHPRYHTKIIRHTWNYTINHNENVDQKEK